MNNSITQKFKRNILVVTIIITLIFLIINVALYIINDNYLSDKVKEENSAFLLITTHIINENDVSVALEYIEHYQHIHKVNIEVLDSDNTMLFSSTIAHQYTNQFQIETLKGDFTVFIDNSDSITVSSFETNTIYVNVSLLIIYIISLIVLLRTNKITSQQIDQDITSVLKLIDSEDINNNPFNHSEFEHIHQIITKYIENIDLLTEQKEMNMKGLAHDIKTPLTIIYSYFEKILKNQPLSDQETKSSFDSAIRINELLNDIIDNSKRQNNQSIDISKLLNDKIDEYNQIFANKDISIINKVSLDISTIWTEKDFLRVIDNLISNAYYYSKESSSLIISVKKEAQLIIEMTSTPSSISDINVSNLFKKGKRGATSHLNNEYGKGYGLYLCKILLDSINGSISAAIINENVKFTIML